MLPSIFEVSKVNAWCHWNEAVCVGAPIKTQIAVFILQRSLLFPILQMYSIHRDPVNIGTVSSPAGNLTVISFFSLKGCIFSNGSLKGIFFFFGLTPPICTLPYWCGMWSDFSRECLCLCWGFSTLAILIDWPGEFFVVGMCPLHCQVSGRPIDSAH